MNPFQRLGVKISNWWRGEPQNDGGKMTLNSPSFLERIGLKRKGKPTSEVTYIDAWKHAMKEEYRPDVNETVNEWLEQYEKYMKKGGEK